MKRTSKKRNLAVFTAIATMSLSMLAGCELLVDFDRTLIDAGSLGDTDATFDGSEDFDATNAAETSTTTDAGDAAVTDSASTNDAGDSAAIDDADDGSDADM